MGSDRCCAVCSLENCPLCCSFFLLFRKGLDSAVVVAVGIERKEAESSGRWVKEPSKKKKYPTSYFFFFFFFFFFFLAFTLCS
jgi:hypothetical protein